MAKFYKSRDWLYARYVMQRKSVQDIAKECQCTPETINYYLNMHKIKETRKK